MISRFFKRKKDSRASQKPSKETSKAASREEKPTKQKPKQKILTAEGWKRMMMRAPKKD